MLDLLVITGASKGIGNSIAKKCADICHKMIVISSSDEIFSVQKDIKNCHPLKLDLKNYDNVFDIVYDTISKNYDPISIGIVLCGSKLGDFGGLLTSDLNDWDEIYKTNVLGNLAVIKACSKFITSYSKMRIVFFAGGGAAFSNPEFSAYALSKVATVKAVENLACEFSANQYNASIIALAPGAVATDMLAKVLEHGGSVRTKTDISEPTNFVYNFLDDQFPSLELNGKFLHVRDNIDAIDFADENLFKLRRVQQPIG
jgi:3-oxoacyl-[acyl-carrier protein] reductase